MWSRVARTSSGGSPPSPRATTSAPARVSSRTTLRAHGPSPRTAARRSARPLRAASGSQAGWTGLGMVVGSGVDDGGGPIMAEERRRTPFDRRRPPGLRPAPSQRARRSRSRPGTDRPADDHPGGRTALRCGAEPLTSTAAARRSAMATIHDVAREAGVSIATVSRSLNGQARVSETTRQRVLAVARALDFIPNRAARGLVTGRPGNVGGLVPDVANPSFGPIVAGIEEIAQARDMGVFLADSREDPDAELGLVRRLGQQADGVVLVASRLPDATLQEIATRTPTVLVNRVVPGLPAVAVDAHQGMRDLLTEVAGLGHRTVVYLDGPVRSWSGRAKR